MCSLGGLHRRRNLGVRGREQAGDLVGQRLVGGEPGELALPEVEIAPGQPVEIGARIGAGIVATTDGRFVVFRGHGCTIAHCLGSIVTGTRLLQALSPSCRTAVSALMWPPRSERTFTVREPEERSVMAEQAVLEGGPKPAPVVIKKYANRRLYNTATSAYVTLEHLSQMVKDKTDFVVYDAKTGDEITRSVLTQIIFEEESKGGQTLLPIPFLRQLISFYGDSLQSVVPQYLEMSMSQFARNQEQMRSYLQNAFGFNPFQQFETMGKQNMAMFEQAMRMFNPFRAGQPGSKQPASGQQVPDQPGPSQPGANGSEAARADTPAASGAAPKEEVVIDDLKRKLDELQNQLALLSKKP
jgi:polyhydroxyalkanoate synthesis repressor PhaR